MSTRTAISQEQVDLALADMRTKAERQAAMPAAEWFEQFNPQIDEDAEQAAALRDWTPGPLDRWLGRVWRGRWLLVSCAVAGLWAAAAVWTWAMGA